MSKEPMGTGQPEDDNIKWVTPKEAQRFVSMVGRQYIKRQPKDGKLPAEQDPKDYIYKIIHVNPYEKLSMKPGGIGDFLMQFQVQKYYRNKTRKAKVDPTTDLEADVNVEVVGHEQQPMGDFVLVDSDAFRSIDCRQFDQEFMPDNL
jgi:hypothetical protein